MTVPWGPDKKDRGRIQGLFQPLMPSVLSMTTKRQIYFIKIPKVREKIMTTLGKN